MAALIAAGAGLLTAIILSSDTTVLAHEPGWQDWVHVSLGMLITPLTFAMVTLVWFSIWERLEALASDGATRLRNAWVCRAVVSLPAVGIPAFAVGYALTVGTSAYKPSSTPLMLAGMAIATSLFGRLLLGLGARALKALQRYGWLCSAGLSVFTATAFTAWALMTSPLGERYGLTQLLSFGLVTAGVTLVWVGALPEMGALRRWGTASFAPLFVIGLIGLSSRPSQAAWELYHFERPTKWSARVMASLLPDADGDGTEANLGFFQGGDCDDRDPQRHPLARDIPDNGVDENCYGADLTREEAARFELEPIEVAALVKESLNVVIIVFDSLRYDRRYPAGVDPKLMPNLARIADRGRSHSNFRTCSPRTRESVGDLLGVRIEGAGARASAIQDLTEAGVHAAFIASDWAARYIDVPGFVERQHPKARYGHFADEVVTANLRGFIASGPPQPFFAFSSFLGAHEPYDPGNTRCNETGDGYARYRCALSELDRKLGSILQTLESSPSAARTLLVVTADHGEEFGEHGGRYHAFTLYDEVLRVPLVLFGPGVERQLVSDPLGCYDFMPVVVSAARWSAEGFTGEPSGSACHLQMARTRNLDEPSLFQPRLVSAVCAGYKAIFDRTTGLTAYYELSRDPGEKSRLPRTPTAIQQKLTVGLDAWLSAQANALASTHASKNRVARTPNPLAIPLEPTRRNALHTRR